LALSAFVPDGTVAFGWTKTRAVFSLITASGRSNVKAMKNQDGLKNQPPIVFWADSCEFEKIQIYPLLAGTEVEL
jgi:hypothetical protein